MPRPGRSGDELDEDRERHQRDEEREDRRVRCPGLRADAVVDGEADHRREGEEDETGRGPDQERLERTDAQRRRLELAARIEERPGRLGRPPPDEHSCEREEGEQREHGHEVRLVDDDEQLAVHHVLPDTERDGPHLRVDRGMLLLGRQTRECECRASLSYGVEHADEDA